MNDKIIAMLRNIFDAQIDRADDLSAYNAWCTARDIVEYAIAENYDCLKEFEEQEENKKCLL